MSNVTHQAPLDRDSRASGNSDEHHGGSVAAGSRVPRSAPGFDSGIAVEVAHLRKAYGTTVAVDDFSFSVAEDEVFGILGPNGAGKTTTVECVIGLRIPDAGTMHVLGLDPRRDLDALHAIVGVQLFVSLAAAASDTTHPAHAFFDKRYRVFRETIADRLGEAQQAGQTRTDLPAERLAALVLAVIDGIQLQWMTDRSVDMTQVVTDLFGLLDWTPASDPGPADD
jgi:energy-coupling factor transporter ATP-binding protein EcfA2